MNNDRWLTQGDVPSNGHGLPGHRRVRDDVDGVNLAVVTRLACKANSVKIMRRPQCLSRVTGTG